MTAISLHSLGLPIPLHFLPWLSLHQHHLFAGSRIILWPLGFFYFSLSLPALVVQEQYPNDLSLARVNADLVGLFLPFTRWPFLIAFADTVDFAFHQGPYQDPVRIQWHPALMRAKSLRRDMGI